MRRQRGRHGLTLLDARGHVLASASGACAMHEWGSRDARGVASHLLLGRSATATPGADEFRRSYWNLTCPRSATTAAARSTEFVRRERDPLFSMRSLVLIVLRVLLELVLVPIRLALALFGAVAVLFGALGAAAWTIQLMVGGGGGGALAPALMWLLSIAVVPVGLVMLILAWIGIEDEPAAVGPGDSPSSRAPAQPDILLDTEGRPTTVVPELHTTVRTLVAPPEQAARLRRASRTALRRTRRGRPL